MPQSLNDPAQADENWLDRLSAAMPGLWIRFSDDGRYVAAGGSQQEDVARAQQLVGMRVADALPADVAQRVGAGIAAALKHGRARMEYTLERDGAERVFDVEFVATSQHDVAAFIADATERVTAQRALGDSERRFRVVVELANEGIWMIDAAGQTTFATPRMADILGSTPAAMIGRSPNEFMDDAARIEFAERQQRRRRGLSEGGAFTFRAADGRSVQTALNASPIYDHDGRYIGAVALVTDETERLRAEREVDEARHRLGVIAAAHGEVIYVGEIRPDGTYHEHFCGPGTERLIGGDIPIGRPLEQFWENAIHGEDRAAYATMNQTLAAGAPADLEYRLVGLDGSVRWVHDRARPRSAKTTEGVVIDGIVSDITDRRKRAEAIPTTVPTTRSFRGVGVHSP